ncbi:Transposon Ty3-G Gag-Pol polyprotein [Sparassis crispa]|uniref:Transposon Ty3-G Gag-Pol polyprotein n=1 Tax=Sparassis crispa TaxID=139825 RepID=A0A401G4S7_9APHY|nr:Transposon Ty3-G Gag-Pol polyprotein [Sparassis crispa]GBE77187.1 Transposon Ty3-G Gag-Pol polyprotein [Sparassis crispa]
MSRFQYKIQYVEGATNKVADCLSRYYENDNADEFTPIQEYANTDAHLDPEWDDLPSNRIAELHAGTIQRSAQLPKDVQESRDQEASEMASHLPLITPTPGAKDEDPMIAELYTNGPPLKAHLEQDTPFLAAVQKGYGEDPLFRKIVESPTEFSTFVIWDKTIYTKNCQDEEVICIPRVLYRHRMMTEIIIDRGHTTIGHYSPQKTLEYIRQWFWWPRIRRDIEKFCVTCGACQTAKPRNHLQAGLLHSLPIPWFSWNSIAMDFVSPFPRLKGYDYLWVVIYRLTSMVHLVPVNTTSMASDIAELYVQEIVRLHGMPESIVSDRDSKFTSKFWCELYRLLGAKLLMSTSFYPQTDRLCERTIRSVSQILRSIVSPNQLDWIDKIPMIEFALNSATSATTGFASFELNYGYLPRMIGGLHGTTKFVGVQKFAQRALANLEIAHNAIIKSHTHQTFQANKLWQEEPEFTTGSKVYLSTQNLALPKGRARKLMPKFIEPYEITDVHVATSNYTLELPQELKDRRILPTFHVSLLR